MFKKIIRSLVKRTINKMVKQLEDSDFIKSLAKEINKNVDLPNISEPQEQIIIEMILDLLIKKINIRELADKVMGDD